MAKKNAIPVTPPAEIKTSEVNEFENLKQENTLLSDENALLKQEVASLKQQMEVIMNGPVANISTKSAVGEKFMYQDEEYMILVGVVNIPVLGKRTAIELLNDPQAQEYLVTRNSSAIKKMAS